MADPTTRLMTADPEPGDAYSLEDILANAPNAGALDGSEPAYVLQGGRLKKTTATLIAALNAASQSVQNNITAFAGGGSSSAVVLTANICRISVVASSGDSVKLRAPTSGDKIVIINDGANQANVYSMSGTVDGLSNSGISLNAGYRVQLWCAADGDWSAVAPQNLWNDVS